MFGTYTHRQNKLLGPGTYSIETGSFTDRAVHEKSQGPNWARAYDLAKLTAIPHMLYKEEWKHKRRLVIVCPANECGRGYKECHTLCTSKSVLTCAFQLLV